MEELAIEYLVVLELISGISGGKTVKFCVQKLKMENSDSFLDKFEFIAANFSNNLAIKELLLSENNIYKRQLLFLVHKSYLGVPILDQLNELEPDIKENCELQLDHFLKSLSFKMMLPLLFVQLPAFLILFYQPILNLFRGIN